MSEKRVVWTMALGIGILCFVSWLTPPLPQLAVMLAVGLGIWGERERQKL